MSDSNTAPAEASAPADTSASAPQAPADTSASAPQAPAGTSTAAPQTPADTSAPAPQAPAPQQAPPAPITPFRVFAATLAATPDEVFTLLMRQLYGSEKNTLQGWQAKLDALRNEPAS